METIFSKAKIKSFEVKNRIVMPPVICFNWADDNGMVTEKHIRHYEEIAKGGAGLIILEAHCIEKDGRLSRDQLGIWSDNHIEGLKRIADACHKYGAVVLVQLQHSGMNTHKSVSETSIGPCNYVRGSKNVKGLSIDEIQAVKLMFVDAARRARAAGLDGIEIQGSQGYLISQFLSPLINSREDEYGGDLVNRTRFACEVIDEIKSELDDDFIIGFRIGGNEPTLEDGIEIAKIIERSCVDLLHVSFGVLGSDIPSLPEGFQYSWIAYCGTQIKKHVDIPVISVGGIRFPKEASELLENGLSDFVAVGRGQLVDPEWANKARSNIEVIPCLKCRSCFWYKDGKDCPGIKNNSKF